MIENWEIFFALGDRHRLSMIESLAKKGPQTINHLLGDFPFSRQAGSKHIDVLAHAGLIISEKRGREKVVSLLPENMNLTRMFMAQMESQWTDRFDDLRSIVEAED